ncbi:MAG TPA: acylphosphatase [Saccharospirillum sp.]|nr:acylphosphatase [Saccharospirillum sp.]
MRVECWQLLVKGRVQGVFFRSATEDIAKSLGLTGWVRNLSDGRVEIMAEGQIEKLNALYDWCLQGGPPEARVDNIQRTEEPVTGQFADFEVVADA